MQLGQAFLSVVAELHGGQLQSQLQKVSALHSLLAAKAKDFELVLVANGLDSAEFNALRDEVKKNLTNTLVLRLTGKVSSDVAIYAGLRNCIGDFIATIELDLTPIEVLGRLLGDSKHVSNVMTATNTSKTVATAGYRMQFALFNMIYERIHKLALDKPGTSLRIFSRAVINQVLQEPDPVDAIRHIPQLFGFDRTDIEFDADVPKESRKHSTGRATKGWSFLVSTSGMPLRLVTSISIFGAIVNVLYAIYVLSVALTDKNVQPGWVSTSLQLSGMFFLVSCSLGVIGEYLLNLTKQTVKAPRFHLAEEVASPKVASYQEINVKLTDD